MGNEVRISKTVYIKDQFDTVVNNDFTTFVDPTPVQDNDTVEELFRLYDKLFYNIPAEGDINSHQYILKRSSELTNLENTSEDLQPLLDEIAQLRAQLLDANQQIFDLETNG